MRAFAPAWHRTCVASRQNAGAVRCSRALLLTSLTLQALHVERRAALFLWAYADNECFCDQLLCRIDILKVTNNKNLSHMKQALLNTWRLMMMRRVVFSSALRPVFCRVLLFRTWR